MSQVINLNKARKAKTRAERAKQANANAVNFGRTKAERQAEAARAKQRDTRLSQHELDT